jgi:hypothetical protein
VFFFVDPIPPFLLVSAGIFTNDATTRQSQQLLLSGDNTTNQDASRHHQKLRDGPERHF